MSLKSFSLIALILLPLSGCAPVNTLPRSAAEANFDASVGGRTGWTEFEYVYMLYDVDMPLAFLAALSGLDDAGFKVTESSLDKRYAIGKYHSGLSIWPASAGIYLKSLPKNLCYSNIPCIAVKIQIEGGKEEGTWKWDKGARSWPQQIFDGMNKFIQSGPKAPGKNQ